MKLTADTYLHSLLAKDIESFRYLAYFLEKEKKKNSVYINISDYNSLANQGKKHAVIIKVDDKRNKVFAHQRNEILCTFSLSYEQK